MTTSPKKFSRININLSESDRQALDALAKEDACDISDVFRHALRLMIYVRSEQNQGSKLLVCRPDQTYKEIVIIV